MDSVGIQVYLITDEASHLADIGISGQHLVTVLKRSCSICKDLNFWTFLLSTQSSLNILANSLKLDPSAHVVGGAKRPRPFSAIEMNLELSSRFTAPGFLSQPLKGFNDPKSWHATEDHCGKYTLDYVWTSSGVR